MFGPTRPYFALFLFGILPSLTLWSPTARGQDTNAPQDQNAATTELNENATETPTPTDGAEESENDNTSDDLDQAKQHFLRGKKLFEAKDFENAVDAFKESYKLSQNPLLLYNIGYTHDEIGDAQMALVYYEKFLRDSDPNAANRDVVNERIAILKGKKEAPVEPQGKAVARFEHVPVDEAPPDMPLDIIAVVPEGVPWRVILNYRATGQATFTSVEMRYRYKELVGRIPIAATKGKTVQYYIEVKDGTGKILERAGRATSPNIVYLEEGAKPRFYADLNPRAAQNPSQPKESHAVTETSSDTHWMDRQSSTFQKLKWGATGGAVGFALLSTTFYLISTDTARQLESDSVASRTDECLMGPPCKSFSKHQKDLESKGQLFETLGTVSLGLSAAALVGAGALWYLDLTDNPKIQERHALQTAPVITPEFLGAAATLRF